MEEVANCLERGAQELEEGVGGRPRDSCPHPATATASPPPGWRDHVTSRDIQGATLGLHQIAPTCRQTTNLFQSPWAAEIGTIVKKASGGVWGKWYKSHKITSKTKEKKKQVLTFSLSR